MASEPVLISIGVFPEVILKLPVRRTHRNNIRVQNLESFECLLRRYSLVYRVGRYFFYDRRDFVERLDRRKLLASNPHVYLSVDEKIIVVSNLLKHGVARKFPSFNQASYDFPAFRP